MLVAPYDGGWALRAGIGITINLLGHPMSVTHNYFNKEEPNRKDTQKKSNAKAVVEYVINR